MKIQFRAQNLFEKWKEAQNRRHGWLFLCIVQNNWVNPIPRWKWNRLQGFWFCCAYLNWKLVLDNKLCGFRRGVRENSHWYSIASQLISYLCCQITVPLTLFTSNRLYKRAIPMTYSCRTDIYYTTFSLTLHGVALPLFIRVPPLEQYVRLFISFYRLWDIKRIWCPAAIYTL